VAESNPANGDYDFVGELWEVKKPWVRGKGGLNVFVCWQLPMFWWYWVQYCVWECLSCDRISLCVWKGKDWVALFVVLVGWPSHCRGFWRGQAPKRRLICSSGSAWDTARLSLRPSTLYRNSQRNWLKINKNFYSTGFDQYTIFRFRVEAGLNTTVDWIFSDVIVWHFCSVQSRFWGRAIHYSPPPWEKITK